MSPARPSAALVSVYLSTSACRMCPAMAKSATLQYDMAPVEPQRGRRQQRAPDKMANSISEASPLLSAPTPSQRRTSTPDMASRIKSALWGPPSVERSLLIKLDFTVLIYFSVVWFLFGINRASYNTAYISGMKEELNFQGKVRDTG